MSRSFIIATCLALALPAHAQSAMQTAPGADLANASSATKQFVEKVAVSDIFEIQSSQLAVEKSSDDAIAVKEFARKMVSDHTKTSNELQLIVQKMRGIQLPTALDDEHREKIEQLRSASGRLFHQQYRNQQIEAHQAAVKLFDHYAWNGDNGEMRSWAEKTLPHLQQHLEQAQALPKQTQDFGQAPSRAEARKASTTESGLYLQFILIEGARRPSLRTWLFPPAIRANRSFRAIPGLSGEGRRAAATAKATGPKMGNPFSSEGRGTRAAKLSRTIRGRSGEGSRAAATAKATGSKTGSPFSSEGRGTRAAKSSRAMPGRNGEGSRAVAPEATGWSAEGSRPAMSTEGTGPKTGGSFNYVIDRFVRDCLQEATQLQSWSFETIARVAMLDDAQRGALEMLRGAAADAAKHLSASCPQNPAASGEEPVAPGGQFQAMERVVDAADTAFALIEPALQDFYSALDDEQKGRLLRDMILSEAQARAGDTAEDRRDQASSRRGESPAPAATVNRWGDICEQLTAALRSWPIQDIERAVRLSEPQRLAFFEVVTSSLKAATTLAARCPAENPVTPVRRMATHRARLAAVRDATRTIQPTLMSFYEALDEGQRVTFAEMR